VNVPVATTLPDNELQAVRQPSKNSFKNKIGMVRIIFQGLEVCCKRKTGSDEEL
jgi:hypothetical protein